MRISPIIDTIVIHRPLTMDIVLGMPKHDCKFHGICRMEPVERLEKYGGGLRPRGSDYSSRLSVTD